MGRQSRDVYDAEDFEPQAWRQVSRYGDHSQGRADSRAPSRARDSHNRGDYWNYDRGWQDRRTDSRSRQVYDQSWRSDWKDERDWHHSDSRSRPSRWRRDSRPRHGRDGRGDSRDSSWRKRGDPHDRHEISRIPERSRSRSVEAGGYGYGYGQSRKGQGLDPGFREEIPPAKAPKAKPGAKKVARKRRPVPAKAGEQPKTFHDPYQLIDPNEQVDHKVILPDERKEPEEEPSQERLGQRRRLPSTGGRGSRDEAVGRSPSRSCSLYSYYSYGSYSFSSGWSTPSPRSRMQNSRSPSPGPAWQSHPGHREVAPGPPPPGPPPGSWSQPQPAEAPLPAGSEALALLPVPCAGPAPQPQYSLHPGPSQPQSAAAWDYRGHPSHYPPPPGHTRPPPHFYGGAFPPARVHYQSPGYPGGPPPPGCPMYSPSPMNQDIGYGRLEARPKIHRQGGRKGMRKDPKDSAEERDHSNTPKRAKKRRRKNRRPKSPGEPPPKWGDTWEEPRSSNGLKLIHELAPKGLKWKVVLSDESRRSYASFMPSPVPSARLGDFFKTIYAGSTAKVESKIKQGPRKKEQAKQAVKKILKIGCRFAKTIFHVFPSPCLDAGQDGVGTT